MITGIRFADDAGDNELVLYPFAGIEPQILTVPGPETREVTQNKAGSDGARDTTKYHGGRAVSLELVLYQDDAEGTAAIEELLDEIAAYMHPGNRPYLYVTRDGWAQERRLLLRTDQWSPSYTGYESSQQQALQLQWKCPTGIWEGPPASQIINATSTDQSGIVFPISFPLSFGTTTASGAATISNPGKTYSDFKALLYGPCQAPKLINDATGEQIAFTSDLTLTAGQYVEIDTDAHTAYLLSDTSQSRLNTVDWSATSWWRLQRGDQSVRYVPSTVSGPAQAILTYRPAWL